MKIILEHNLILLFLLPCQIPPVCPSSDSFSLFLLPCSVRMTRSSVFPSVYFSRMNSFLVLFSLFQISFGFLLSIILFDSENGSLCYIHELSPPFPFYMCSLYLLACVNSVARRKTENCRGHLLYLEHHFFPFLILWHDVAKSVAASLPPPPLPPPPPPMWGCYGWVPSTPSGFPAPIPLSAPGLAYAGQPRFPFSGYSVCSPYFS